MAASCLNAALEAAASEPQPTGKLFSPQNWIKAKTCLGGIKTSVSGFIQLMTLPTFPGGKELKESLVIPAENFEYRWEAD